MPVLDLIKQEEQGAGPARAVRQEPVGQSRRPAARLVVDTFVRAIETSDFERRLQRVEVDCSNRLGAKAGLYGAGRTGTTTFRRNYAADALLIAGRATIGSISDCSRPTKGIEGALLPRWIPPLRRSGEARAPLFIKHIDIFTMIRYYAA